MNYFVAPVSCGTPRVVLHAANDTTGTDYTNIIIYECLHGYEKTSGNLARICQADKDWSGKPPECCKYNLICFDLPITI